MTPIKFRKKPVVVEAMQFSKETALQIKRWVTESNETGYIPVFYNDGIKLWIEIPTLEGTMRADDRDFIVKGPFGEFYPVKPDIFEVTYALAEEEEDAKEA